MVVLFRSRFWPGLADGSVTVTFRRWSRPQAKAGGRYRTGAGMLAVDAVDLVDVAVITDDDARRAGYPSRDDLVADLPAGQGPVQRIAFHHDGPDPRDTMREATPDAAELEAIEARLAKLDGATPWTRTVLELIATRPAVRAGDLATALGRERLGFKADVRKLKALGLTESLEVGYRLSPRGRAVLDHRGQLDR